MKLTNAMESAVKAHVNRVRSELRGDDTVCWCPLCRADMMAYALSALPPRYGTRRVAAVAPGSEQDAAVAAVVSRAVRQVSLHPKHDTGVPAADHEPVFVVNFPLEESFRAVDAVMGPDDEACACWHCRCDTVAFALNRYPARYGVEHRGETHLRDSDRAVMREELGQFLGLARSVVATVPRHELSPVS
jgi:hypothetical protein